LSHSLGLLRLSGRLVNKFGGLLSLLSLLGSFGLLFLSRGSFLGRLLVLSCGGLGLFALRLILGGFSRLLLGRLGSLSLLILDWLSFRSLGLLGIGRLGSFSRSSGGGGLLNRLVVMLGLLLLFLSQRIGNALGELAADRIGLNSHLGVVVLLENLLAILGKSRLLTFGSGFLLSLFLFFLGCFFLFFFRFRLRLFFFFIREVRIFHGW